MSDNVVPIHQKARDGRRVLRDQTSNLDPQQYARQPDTRVVQLNLPTELLERIDELAKADLLPRAAWLRREIALMLREHDRATA
jgi:hypothetical protein